MTVEIISWSISTKVWDRAGIELSTPVSTVRLASVARHLTDSVTRPVPLCSLVIFQGIKPESLRNPKPLCFSRVWVGPGPLSLLWIRGCNSLIRTFLAHIPFRTQRRHLMTRLFVAMTLQNNEELDSIIDNITPGRLQSKTLILSTNVDQKSLETEFSIAICRPTGDKWQSKPLFLAIFDPRLSILKSVFGCQLLGVNIYEPLFFVSSPQSVLVW